MGKRIIIHPLGGKFINCADSNGWYINNFLVGFGLGDERVCGLVVGKYFK